MKTARSPTVGRGAFQVRAPGRINLIGEHIDYCGLDVLPMAIQRSVVLHVEPARDSAIRLESDAAGFPPVAFHLDEAAAIARGGGWGIYPAAAVAELGLAAEARERCGVPDLVRGFRARVCSDLPPEAGLSSSSALTVATLLACIGAQLDDEARGRFPGRASMAVRRELAALAASAERRTGTAGGGMDPAASLLGTDGHALRVGFHPLRATPIPVPSTWRFVVAHSGERAAKSGEAREAYNQRAADAADARARAAHALGHPDMSWPELIRDWPARARTRVAAGLPGSVARRFRHVSSEAERVSGFEAALRAQDAAQAGRILTASHRSLAEDFDVSTPALDRLVAAALAAGAFGARLTGAGLGGCVIALSDPAHEDAVMAALGRVSPEVDASGERVPRPFSARPSAGACIEPLA